MKLLIRIILSLFLIFNQVFILFLFLCHNIFIDLRLLFCRLLNLFIFYSTASTLFFASSFKLYLFLDSDYLLIL